MRGRALPGVRSDVDGDRTASLGGRAFSQGIPDRHRLAVAPRSRLVTVDARSRRTGCALCRILHVCRRIDRGIFRSALSWWKHRGCRRALRGAALGNLCAALADRGTRPAIPSSVAATGVTCALKGKVSEGERRPVGRETLFQQKMPVRLQFLPLCGGRFAYIFHNYRNANAPLHPHSKR